MREIKRFGEQLLNTLDPFKRHKEEARRFVENFDKIRDKLTELGGHTSVFSAREGGQTTFVCVRLICPFDKRDAVLSLLKMNGLAPYPSDMVDNVYYMAGSYSYLLYQGRHLEDFAPLEKI